MTEHVAFPKDGTTRLLGLFVVTLGGFLMFITLIVSYDTLFGLGLGWTTSAILSVIVFWGVTLLWGPIILLIYSVMLSLFAKVPDLSTFGFRIPGKIDATWGT
jgi:hypothetical protein